MAGKVLKRFVANCHRGRIIVCNQLHAPGVSVAIFHSLSLMETDGKRVDCGELHAWSACTSDTASHRCAEGLIVVTNTSEAHYQIASPDFILTPGVEYTLSFDCTSISGLMAVGVLDVDADVWLSAPEAPDRSYNWAKLSPCPLPWTSAMIYPDGHVQACCFNSTNLGNVNQHDFATIWNGEAYRDLRAALIEKRYDTAGCGDCAMYARAGWTTQMAAEHEFTNSFSGTDQQIANIQAIRAAYEEESLIVDATPSTLMLELSELCNYDCTFCFQVDKLTGLREERVRGLIGTMLPQVRRLTMTGGEPLVFKENLNLLRGMSEAQAATTSLELYTNGALLERHLPMLEKFDNFHCVISLHSLHDPAYKVIMKSKNGVEQVVSAIAAFRAVAARKPDWKMTLTNIVMRSNRTEMMHLAQFAIEQGCDVQFVHMHGDFAENLLWEPKGEELAEAVMSLTAAKTLLEEAGKPYTRSVENINYCLSLFEGARAA